MLRFFFLNHCHCHRFPTNEQLRLRWYDVLGLTLSNTTPASSLRVCSLHFRPEDYIPWCSKKLKQDAIPLPVRFFALLYIFSLLLLCSFAKKFLFITSDFVAKSAVLYFDYTHKFFKL